MKTGKMIEKGEKHVYFVCEEIRKVELRLIVRVRVSVHVR